MTASTVRVTGRTVTTRRLVGLLLVVVPLVWAWQRAVPDGANVVNHGGLSLIGDLFASALHPQLSADFFAVVLDATVVTLVFATLGTAGALVVGLLGGLVLSDAAWRGRPPLAVRMVRLLLRGVLVAARSIQELVWALLFVSVLGLDPLVAVLAIIVPFGAQTAKVFGETLDGVPSGPLLALRNVGARPAAVVCYALLPPAAPLLLSYAFYRFECAVRSAVVLGVVGVGGLGQELVVSLQSRNWDEVWTVVWAVLLLSAVVACGARACAGIWRSSPAPTGSGGRGRASGASRWARLSLVVALSAVPLAWLASDVSLSGLTSPRTGELTARLLDDLWPPALPPGGWPALGAAVQDNVAMAVLAMAIAVTITAVIGPWATRRPSGSSAERRGGPHARSCWHCGRSRRRCGP